VPAPRVAVVGHAEWVTFARVPRLPAPGEIVHAEEVWEAPGGGGGIVAALLGRMAGACAFLTAVGSDGLAEALEAFGVQVHSAARGPASRRIFTHLDGDGERAITVLGARLDPAGADPLPWPALRDADAVFVTAGDEAAVRAARAARVLVATPRAGAALAAAVPDVLVLSGEDPDELAAAERLPAAPVRVETLGARGGRWAAADGAGGTWDAAPLPGPPVDAFGNGDAFAAGLTLGLAAGQPLADAIALAARCGAATAAARGPYGAAEALAALAAPIRTGR